MELRQPAWKLCPAVGQTYFLVGFALSLLVFRDRLQTTSPERGKAAAKNHQEKDRGGLA